VYFKVANGSVQDGTMVSPPTLAAASPGVLNSKGLVSTAVYAKNLEMRLEEVEDGKKRLELELRAMKLEQQKGQSSSENEQQKLQV
jgi:hypothetical protein